jgi:hypothetical protein
MCCNYCTSTALWSVPPRDRVIGIPANCWLPVNAEVEEVIPDVFATVAEVSLGPPQVSAPLRNRCPFVKGKLDAVGNAEFALKWCVDDAASAATNRGCPTHVSLSIEHRYS